MAEEFSTAQTAESHATTPKKRASDKLHLDDYIHFLHSRHFFQLTMNQLNQVIRIHGFNKLHHAHKKVLVDAVDALDLMNLQRSTLRESVSALAEVTLEDAVVDLTELNWQECCVTSIKKLSASNSQSLFLASSDQNLTNHSQPQSKDPKTKRINEIYSLIPETFRSSMKATKMVPKRKRSNLHALDSAASTVDSASLASC